MEPEKFSNSVIWMSMIRLGELFCQTDVGARIYFDSVKNC